MNDNNIKILVRFLLFLAVLGCVCLYGITNAFALETKTIYSVNNNGTLSSANTYNYGYLTGGGTIGSTRANINTTISGKSYGFMFLFYENIVLNKTYTMVINFMDIDLLKTFNSSMVHISTCNGDTCNENILVSVEKSSNTGNSNKLTIKFNPISTGTYILVNLGGNNEAITGVSTFGIKNVTLDSSNQNEDIMNNANQNANNIINNQNSNTQDIINSNQTNASAIIDNQNQNTQQQIESQQVCSTIKIDKNSITQSGYALNNIGNASLTGENLGVTDYINIENVKKITNITISGTDFQYYMCTYNTSKTMINCYNRSSYNGTFISINDNEKYVRFTINNSTDRPQFEFEQCKNGNQALNDNINNLNDNLTDSSPVDMSTLGDVAGWLPAGPIDSIINLPLTFMNNLYTALSGTCSSLHVPIPYLDHKYIDIPCISTIYEQINGFSVFWNWVGGITSVLILYKYLLALYKYYDDLTTLKANFISDFGGAP